VIENLRGPVARKDGTVTWVEGASRVGRPPPLKTTRLVHTREISRKVLSPTVIAANIVMDKYMPFAHHVKLNPFSFKKSTLLLQDLRIRMHVVGRLDLLS
jgi:hypothetical protein